MKNAILKTVVATAGMLLLSSITANAQDHEGHDHKAPEQVPSVDAIFEKMDANKDGKLAADEVKGPLSEKFAVIDADADGFITKEEMESAPKPEKPMAE